MPIISFREFYQERRLHDWPVTEAFDQAQIMGHRPENAQWFPAVDQPALEHEYRFSLPSDPEKIAPDGRPPYILTIRGSDSVTISFKHVETGLRDRFDQNKELMASSGGNPGHEMMMSVLHGISEYIGTNKPSMINWSPIEKSRPDAKNKKARAGVYQLWAVKNLAGEYVPVAKDNWMRADAYKRYAAETGLPPYDPQQYKGTKGAEAFVAAVDDHKRKEEEEEQETARQAADQTAQAVLNDPAKNPHGLKLGDLVYAKSEQGQKAKLAGVMGDLRTSAHLIHPDAAGNYRTPTSHWDYDVVVPLDQLVPVTPYTTQVRNRRVRDQSQIYVNQYIAHQYINVGSEVQYGDDREVGTVESLRFDKVRRTIMLTVVGANGQRQEVDGYTAIRVIPEEEKEREIARHNHYDLKPGDHVQDNEDPSSWGTLSHWTMSPVDRSVFAHYHLHGDTSQEPHILHPSFMEPRTPQTQPAALA